MNVSKRMLKISIGILLLGLITTSAFAYHLWTTKQISMNARISTVLNLGIYNDTECTIPITTIDWGVYGSGSKDKIFYIKNLGNDKGYFTWNLTSNGWTIHEAYYGSSKYYYYSNENFNFSILGEYASNPGVPSFKSNIYPEGTPENYYYLLQPGEVGHLWFVCWTQAYLACESSWTIYFNFYDNLA